MRDHEARIGPERPEKASGYAKSKPDCGTPQARKIARKTITKCQHSHRKYYCGGMCKYCYHHFRRLRRLRANAPSMQICIDL